MRHPMNRIDKLIFTKLVSDKLVIAKFILGSLCLATIVAALSPLSAREFTPLGTTFAIEETSFLDMLHKRLQNAEASGKLEEMEAEAKKRIQKQVLYPKAVPGIRKTEVSRHFYYDPTLTVEDDIKDHRGVVIHHKGKRVNPLDYTSWGSPMLFIDGDDEAQVVWALREHGHHHGKIVLVKGSPIELHRELQRAHKAKADIRFYFDQGGKICERFHMDRVPARITQEGNRLRIDEVVVDPSLIQKSEKDHKGLSQQTTETKTNNNHK